MALHSQMMDEAGELQNEVARLKAEVVTLAKLGDFSDIRLSAPMFKAVVQMKQRGTYTPLTAVQRG